MFHQTGESLHGFTVTRIREAEELGGRLVEMVYDKTGTELCWVDNGLENKLFSIAFKTLPEDSTGVFHILEHSVLCGSKKYPVREPFVELLKSSMNTFLNAMTFPDKTMYPVSSRNTRDFLNLTEVYLDAVFAPAILENPNIFYQEGWHIEEDETGTLSYKGVVFNEMKGAMSGVDELAEYKLLELLYPDTCYGCNSGGEPSVIPQLSYEQFKETYHRFYHPSNARIFLDGDVPIDETLKLIAEYLSQYEKSDALPEIQMQTPKSAEAVQYYELAKDEPLENQGCLTVGRIVGTWKDDAKLMAMQILFNAVAGTNETPIKRAVLSAGLAGELDISIEPSVAQPYLMIHVKNVTDGKADEILPLIRKTAAELAEQGLDYTALESYANRYEFQLLEPEEPQGLARCILCMNSWLHGGDPMQYLRYKAEFAQVKEMLKNHAFEALLRETLVDETGTVILHTLPSYTSGEELRKAEAERLAKIKAGWSEADLEANRKLNLQLQEWQQTPDSPEQLAALPTLPLSEVSEVPSWCDTVESTCENVTLLYHKAACQGIVHITLTFRLTDFSAEELSVLNHISSLYGILATENYSALELQQKLKNTVGRFETNLDICARKDETETCTPVFSVRFSVLEEKLTDAFSLIEEVLLRTDFRQKDKIREIIVQTNERLKQMGVTSGHALGLTSVMSRYSAKAALRSMLIGYPYIKRTQQLVRDFDNEFDALAGLMEKVRDHSLCRARIYFASVTAAKEADISGLLRRFAVGEAVPENMRCSVNLPEKMGYTIPAQIGFAVQGWQFDEAHIRYNPCWQIAAKIISLSYLWNVVRVQGGAYGTGLTISWNGSVYTYSYRDPSPARSLEANASISEYIRAFCASDESLDGFIISSVNDGDPLRSPRDEGMNADLYWVIGRTKEDVVDARRKMLKTTREDLLNSCKVWDAFAQNGAVCVCASENLLAGCEGLEIVE